MTNTGKIQAIQSVLLLNDPDKRWYIKLLEDLGDLKTNYTKPSDYFLFIDKFFHNVQAFLHTL